MPQMRHRGLVADEATRAVAQHGLFFGEDECHGSSASVMIEFVGPLFLQQRETGCTGIVASRRPGTRVNAATLPADRECAWRQCRASPRTFRLRSNSPWYGAMNAGEHRRGNARFPI